MHNQIPAEARLASRVVLIDQQDRVLFFRVAEPLTGDVFWVMPGGGLDPNEPFEDAARRELHEETGITAPIGPCIWYRRHRHTWNGHDIDQFEKFFVARIQTVGVISGTKPDSYLTDSRWWTVNELLHSTEVFAPRRIAHLLPAVLRGEIAESPFDCGI